MQTVERENKATATFSILTTEMFIVPGRWNEWKSDNFFLTIICCVKIYYVWSQISLV